MSYVDAMKIDAHHTKIESIQETKDEG